MTRYIGRLSRKFKGYGEASLKRRGDNRYSLPLVQIQLILKKIFPIPRVAMSQSFIFRIIAKKVCDRTICRSLSHCRICIVRQIAVFNLRLCDILRHWGLSQLFASYICVFVVCDIATARIKKFFISVDMMTQIAFLPIITAFFCVRPPLTQMTR